MNGGSNWLPPPRQEKLPSKSPALLGLTPFKFLYFLYSTVLIYFPLLQSRSSLFNKRIWYCITKGSCSNCNHFINKVQETNCFTKQMILSITIFYKVQLWQVPTSLNICLKKLWLFWLFFQSLYVVLINVIATLMMLAKLATAGLLRITVLK